jgi:nucleotide-binding universal stress UspA family protein
MLPISRILVPVDFSERCLAILPYARTIATKYNAELVLFHVFNPVYTVPPAGPIGPAIITLPRVDFEEESKRLDAFGVEQLEGCRVKRVIYEGDPAGQIVAFTGSEEVQLIVLPTHGLGVLRRFLLGSVTAKVLHDVVCPVFTGVHIEQSSPPKADPFTNVLCAVDLSPASERALAWAAQFAEAFDARLGIVHALPSSSLGTERADIEKLRLRAGAKAAAVYIREGDPAKTVVSVASSTGADLLVIGRAAHDEAPGRLRRNAYAMISQSPCPVVSV